MMPGTGGLTVIQVIAAGDYETFGMMLLKDPNGQRIDLLTKGLSNVKATEDIIKEWLLGNIPPDDPYPRTYRHLVECINGARMGALAEHIETTMMKKGIVCVKAAFSCVMYSFYNTYTLNCPSRSPPSCMEESKPGKHEPNQCNQMHISRL